MKKHPSQHGRCVDGIDIHEGLDASLKSMPRQPSQPEVTVAEGTTTQALRLEIGEREGRNSTAGRAYGYRRHEDGFGADSIAQGEKTKTPSERGLENVSPTSSIESNNKSPYDQN